ncbi:hypothetical protein LK533_11845 [Sphingomonas sp. PL-96]|uniref:hypothetical protein n=1 Tax=Sphingomonas sp. PL-96 TaxID=2887201 RepID=UPI001E283A5A|nr:hypothetical protein [Sphingomonas sp. PL-96]MCC2977364.1 hypothetical protein [Sphingomonas sp. PL-96]
MLFQVLALIATGASGAGFGQAAAQDPVRDLLGCRSVAEDAARLQCLDRRAAELAQRLERGDVTVSTRAEVAQVQAAQFGRSAPATIHSEPARQPATEPPRSIDTTIRSASRTADGKWVMILADGARWQQIDGRTLSQDPRAGMRLAIRRAAMGSFLANVAGQTAIRVRRLD